MHLIERAAYRIWQFWQTITARPLTSSQWMEIVEILSAAEMRLFSRQDLTGQNHGYRVMKKLADAGYDDHNLLAAALLHDVGKYEYRPAWWDRPVVVLAEFLFPSQVSKWANSSINRWNKPFIVKAYHAEWGAAAAARQGSRKETVWLINNHQMPIGHAVTEENRLLKLLQWADNSS